MRFGLGQEDTRIRKVFTRMTIWIVTKFIDSARPCNKSKRKHLKRRSNLRADNLGWPTANGQVHFATFYVLSTRRHRVLLKETELYLVNNLGTYFGLFPANIPPLFHSNQMRIKSPHQPNKRQLDRDDSESKVNQMYKIFFVSVNQGTVKDTKTIQLDVRYGLRYLLIGSPSVRIAPSSLSNMRVDNYRVCSQLLLAESQCRGGPQDIPAGTRPRPAGLLTHEGLFRQH